MRNCVGTDAVEAMKNRADPHTRYIFEQGYTEDKLPSWRVHAVVREEGTGGEPEDGIGAGEGASGSDQRTLASFGFGSRNKSRTRSRSRRTRSTDLFSSDEDDDQVQLSENTVTGERDGNTIEELWGGPGGDRSRSSSLAPGRRE